MEKEMHSSSGAGVVELAVLFKLFTSNFRFGVALAVLFSVLGFSMSYLVRPTFLAKATILPPQQQLGASSALQSISSLTGLGAGGKNPLDQFIAFLHSNTVADHVISGLKLKGEFGVKTNQEARDALNGSVQIVGGKKDGLIYIEVEDINPVRAAAIANQYAEELARIVSKVTNTEARQRREFYAAELQEVEKKLAQAEGVLAQGAIDEGVVNSDPRFAAEPYINLKSQIAASEIRLRALSYSNQEASPEIKKERSYLAALKAEFNSHRGLNSGRDGVGFLSKFRELKYQEKLKELLSQQYEMARLEERNESVLVQVIDKAEAPERKARPRRLYWGLSALLGSISVVYFGLVFMYLFTGRLYELKLNGGKLVAVRFEM